MVYGNIFESTSNNSSVELNKYIDECFLKSCCYINESAVSEKLLCKILGRDEIGTISTADISKLFNYYKNKSTTGNITQVCIWFARLMLSLFLCAMGQTSGIKGILFSSASIVNSMSIIIKPMFNDKYLFNCYKEFVQISAKAKVQKRKLEALENKDDPEVQRKIKNCENIIEAYEQLKKKEKESTRESTVITEMKGNDVKNQVFKDILEEIDDICKMNYDKVILLSTTLNKIINLESKINDKNITTSSNEALKIYNDLLSKYKNFGKSYNMAITATMVRSEIKKFNNKYSESSMNERLKTTEKLEKIKEDLKKIAKVVKDLNKKHNENYDKICDMDAQKADFLNNKISDIGKTACSEINATIKDIDIFIKELNAKKLQDSPIFKFLNPKYGK